MAERFVRDATSGTGNRTWNIAKTAREITISNTGAAALTFTIEGITVTVDADEVYTDLFESFNQVVIAASGAWKAVVRG